MGRISVQAASKNLDTSEKMSLGGATGVRAYPTGKANGDEGTLAQLELRYQSGAYAPYVFNDAGRIKVNANPTLAATNNTRDLAGVGAGLRYQRGALNLDAVLAWRTQGGAAQADTSGDPKPRVWLNLGWSF